MQLKVYNLHHPVAMLSELDHFSQIEPNRISSVQHSVQSNSTYTLIIPINMNKDYYIFSNADIQDIIQDPKELYLIFSIKTEIFFMFLTLSKIISRFTSVSDIRWEQI